MAWVIVSELVWESMMQSPHSRYAESSWFPVGMSDPQGGDRAGTSNKLPVTQAT